MKPIATLSPAALSRTRTRVSLVILCASVVAVSGCAEQKVKAKTFPWSTAAVVRPKPVEILATSNDQPDDISADLQLDVPPPPSPLAFVQSAPQRPRVAPAPSGQNAAARPEPPQIMPQLTAEETTAAQQQTNVSLSIAERNIAVTQGKNLNPTQLDLASKVRSFVTEARESAHTGDWERARNAAKKAQVLSEELVSSL
jgi:hypothetical protein